MVITKAFDVLLIDDDESFNFLHKIVLRRYTDKENIRSFDNPEKGLDFLLHCDEEDIRCPDVIFLDLNMPKINGWKFLEEYGKILEMRNCRLPGIYILTSSVNPDDRDRSKNEKLVTGYYSKPLTDKIVEEVFQCM